MTRGLVQDAFQIGELHMVEPSLNRVTGPAGTTRLEPKVMQVLLCLAEHAGDVVSKERLISTVWVDTAVGDDVLTRAVSELRRLFGDEAKHPRVIETIPKGGYRLIASVTLGRATRANRNRSRGIAGLDAGGSLRRVRQCWCSVLAPRSGSQGVRPAMSGARRRYVSSS